ncbi:MAG: hypothetical protein JO110_02370 [Acetobacteraceae bacterium]|nr:hypothetical protein [Acetobacteraceae bacterium]
MDDAPPQFPHMANSPLATAEELVKGLARTVRVARCLVESAREVDLSGLKEIVGLLCARALDLDPKEGRMLRPKLAALQQEMDALQVALTRAGPGITGESAMA